MDRIANDCLIRAKRLFPVAENAARGKALFAPLQHIDNGALYIKDGQIAWVGPFKSLPRPKNTPLVDLGDVSLIPGLINCHAHLDLSHLAEKTTWGKGFVPWLQSLIALAPRSAWTDQAKEAIALAIKELVSAGTRLVGSICTPGPRLEAIDASAHAAGLGLIHFAEFFGFATQAWQEELACHKTQAPIYPAGHALYSTAAESLTALANFCAQQGKTFSLHLAESIEESEMLSQGTGPLASLFAQKVLPPTWTAPKASPIAYADKLKLLGPHLLAVHCVQVQAKESALMAERGVSVCLCPRSNKNLAVGTAPIKRYIENNILLVLGTDGLSSNTDLLVQNEARYLQETEDIAIEALIRMLTVNAAQALNLPKGTGSLLPGSPATVYALKADGTL